MGRLWLRPAIFAAPRAISAHRFRLRHGDKFWRNIGAFQLARDPNATPNVARKKP